MHKREFKNRIMHACTPDLIAIFLYNGIYGWFVKLKLSLNILLFKMIVLQKEIPSRIYNGNKSYICPLIWNNVEIVHKFVLQIFQNYLINFQNISNQTSKASCSKLDLIKWCLKTKKVRLKTVFPANSFSGWNAAEVKFRMHFPHGCTNCFLPKKLCFQKVP